MVEQQTKSHERRRRREELARLEADMAYFQARLEMIREPETANQLAQLKVFKLLSDKYAGMIGDAQRQFSQFP